MLKYRNRIGLLAEALTITGAGAFIAAIRPDDLAGVRAALEGAGASFALIPVASNTPEAGAIVFSAIPFGADPHRGLAAMIGQCGRAPIELKGWSAALRLLQLAHNNAAGPITLGGEWVSWNMPQ